MDDPTRGRPLTGSSIPDDLEATLVLVRHGESRYIAEGRFQGQADSPLSELGRDQAARVAARIGDPGRSPALPVPASPPREIVHSPLGRAAETAAAIRDASPGDVPIRADAGFLEIGQGTWEGLHRDEILDRFSAELAGWRARPAEVWAPGGESLAAVSERLRPAIAAMLAGLASDALPSDAPSSSASPVAGYPGAQAAGPWSVIVAHDGVFKVLLLSLFELPLDRFWMWSFELCGITVVDLRGGRAVLRAHNLADHLAPRLDAVAAAEARSREATGAL